MDLMTKEDIDAFWDMYQEGGAAKALAYTIAMNGSLKALEGDVPGLVAAARTKDIDLLKFLKELDEYLTTEKNNDTNGASDDGRELHADSSGEADSAEDSGERESDESDDRSSDSEADD